MKAKGGEFFPLGLLSIPGNASFSGRGEAPVKTPAPGRTTRAGGDAYTSRRHAARLEVARTHATQGRVRTRGLSVPLDPSGTDDVMRGRDGVRARARDRVGARRDALGSSRRACLVPALALLCVLAAPPTAIAQYPAAEAYVAKATVSPSSADRTYGAAVAADDGRVATLIGLGSVEVTHFASADATAADAEEGDARAGRRRRVGDGPRGCYRREPATFGDAGRTRRSRRARPRRRRAARGCGALTPATRNRTKTPGTARASWTSGRPTARETKWASPPPPAAR